MTKFYIKNDGTYVGAFDGDTGKVPFDVTEVPSAPLNAKATWDGSKWIEPEIPRDMLVQTEVVKQGVTNEMVIQALLRKVGYNDSALLDELLAIIAEAEKKIP